MQLNSLTNKGVVLVNPALSETEKTIIVVGVARGGTSIVAGSLKHLGLFMGNAGDPVYEDTRLSLAFEKQSKEKFETVIADYNRLHDIWAWKRPSSLNDLSRIARKLRNPHFIFVFRDMLSIANRNTISMHSDIKQGLKLAFDDYKKIIKFIGKTNHPALLISSEKVVKNKAEFIDALSEFCQITSTDDQIEAAKSFLTPNPKAYLEATRLTKAKGELDLNLLKCGIVKGWSCYAINHGVTEVEVVVNGEVAQTLSAETYNEHYKKPGKHPTGECGFELDLKPLGIKPQDKIEVRVKGDVVNLHAEPITLEELDNWLERSEVEKWVNPKGAINVNLLQTGLLRGWARTQQADKPAKIGIYINGDKLAEVPATIYREHLNKPEVHPTGNCGFEFNCKMHGVLPSDEIEVTVENANYKLHPKPILHTHLEQWLTHQELQQLNQQKGS